VAALKGWPYNEVSSDKRNVIALARAAAVVAAAEDAAGARA